VSTALRALHRFDGYRAGQQCVEVCDPVCDRDRNHVISQQEQTDPLDELLSSTIAIEPVIELVALCSLVYLYEAVPSLSRQAERDIRPAVLILRS